MENLNSSEKNNNHIAGRRETYDRARKNVSHASEKIQEGLHEIADETRNVTRAGVDYASELTDEGIRRSKDYVKEASEQISTYVKKKPVQSMLIAAGLGLLLGRKLTSRS